MHRRKNLLTAHIQLLQMIEVLQKLKMIFYYSTHIGFTTYFSRDCIYEFNIKDRNINSTCCKNNLSRLE